MTELREKYRTCVEGLRSFTQEAGFSEVVLGLSGGIDSALVATMCVDAFGSARVHGVLMPGPYSSDHSLIDARELADNLGIQINLVSIVEPYESFVRELATSCGGVPSSLVLENIQARCRMVVLMALSNQQGWLPVNTGNKSESLVGYSTLHGDMVGAFAPLGNLYKTEVFKLASWRNEQAKARGETPPIPQRTLEKPPSAELAAGQEDEKSLGITYALLDRILQALVDEGLSEEDLVLRGYDRGDIDLVAERVRASRFKRAYEPPCVL